MSRETKLGITIAGSFLCLLGMLVAHKLLSGDSSTPAPLASGTVAPVGSSDKDKTPPRNDSPPKQNPSGKPGAAPGGTPNQLSTVILTGAKELANSTPTNPKLDANKKLQQSSPGAAAPGSETAIGSNLPIAPALPAVDDVLNKKPPPPMGLFGFPYGGYIGNQKLQPLAPGNISSVLPKAPPAESESSELAEQSIEQILKDKVDEAGLHKSAAGETNGQSDQQNKLLSGGSIPGKGEGKPVQVVQNTQPGGMADLPKPPPIVETNKSVAEAEEKAKSTGLPASPPNSTSLPKTDGTGQTPAPKIPDVPPGLPGFPGSDAKSPLLPIPDPTVPPMPTGDGKKDSAAPPGMPAPPGTKDKTSKSAEKKVADTGVIPPLPNPGIVGVNLPPSAGKSGSPGDTLPPLPTASSQTSPMPAVFGGAAVLTLPADKGISVPQQNGGETKPVPTASGTIPMPPPLPSVGAGPGKESPPINVAVPPANTAKPGKTSTVPVSDYQVQLIKCDPQTLSFDALSQKYYGSGRFAAALWKYNRDYGASANLQENPAKLKAGDQIQVPPQEVLQSHYSTDIVAAQTLPAAPPFAFPPNSAPPIKISSNNLPSLPPGQPLKNVPPANSGVYTVQGNGEMLYEIARRSLGDGRRWIEIYRLNPQIVPEQPLPVGTQLRMPVASRTQ